MTTTSDQKSQGMHEEFRALTLTNLLMAIAFLAPIAILIGDLKNARSGLLRYAAGLPSAMASAMILIFIEWHLLKLIWTQSERYSRKWSEAAGTVLWLFVLIFWLAAGAMIGDLIAGLLIRHIR